MNQASGHRAVCVIGTPWPGGLGDAIVFNAFLSVVARGFPDSELTYVVGDGPAAELSAGGHLPVERVVTCPGDYEDAPQWWEEFFEDSCSAGCDCGVFEPSAQSALLGPAARHGISSRIGLVTGDLSDELLTTPVQVPRGATRRQPDLVDFVSAFATALGLPAPQAGNVVPSFRYRRERVAKLPRPVVAVHPGGAPDWNRRWPLQRYGHLCQELLALRRASFILLGTTEESPDLERVRDDVMAADPRARIDVVAGRSLDRLASEIARADVLVGNDSAPAHLAAALNTPSVVIYGPSVNEPWWHRAYSHHRAVNHHAACGTDERCFGSDTAPCQHACRYPYSGASGPYPRCLTEIAVGEVLGAVLEQLGSRS